MLVLQEKWGKTKTNINKREIINEKSGKKADEPLT